jgi:hypothetical protein
VQQLATLLKTRRSTFVPNSRWYFLFRGYSKWFIGEVFWLSKRQEKINLFFQHHFWEDPTFGGGRRGTDEGNCTTQKQSSEVTNESPVSEIEK